MSSPCRSADRAPVACSALSIAVAALLLIPAGCRAPLSPQAPGPTRNVYGVNLGFGAGWDTTGTVRLLGLAHHLVGDWGYIRHGVSLDGSIDQVRRGMAMVRAHRLIPVSGGAYPLEADLEPGQKYPRLDPDGTMRTAARNRARAWGRAWTAGIPLYAVEVLNEVNIGSGWPPDKYAQWLYDFSVAVKQAYPGIRVCSCGMAGSGEEYYDAILSLKPELKRVVDFWGLHPYGANHPPEHPADGCSLQDYKQTMRVLEEHGIDPIRLMCTETGYELEWGETGQDADYPPIDEENRAAYMARAFHDYFSPTPEIECVAVFQLWDLPWHNWNGWDLMYHDGRPRPMYQALAEQPKPANTDWMPSGPGSIRGRVTWADTGIGVPRVVIFTEPGLYAALTDAQGTFRIRGVPAGVYRVTAFRDGFTSAVSQPLTVTTGRSPVFRTALQQVSLIPHDFQRVDAGGWARTGAGPAEAQGPVQEGDCEGRSAWRISGAPGQDRGLVRYGGYNSAYPQEVFVAEILVRTEAGAWTEEGGPYLELALTTGRGEPTVVARARPEGFCAGSGPQRITAALCGPARSSRVRLTFGVSDAEGEFFFSDPFVGEAEFPLPSDRDWRTTTCEPPRFEANQAFFPQSATSLCVRNPHRATGILQGRVQDFRGTPLSLATVALDTPVFCTVTDADGGFSLAVPVGIPLRIRAFAPGEAGTVSAMRAFGPGEVRRLDLQTAPPPAPGELVNGDFNTFHPTEPGIMTGWTGFGTTDGVFRSGGCIFEVPSFEGDGFYFAQSGSNTKNGGAFQTVRAVPGTRYRLTGRVYTRTEGGGRRPFDNTCRLGIDPTGGRDPESDRILWTPPCESEQEWTALELEAEAEAVRLTVFLRHEMRRGNTWNLTLFDDLGLTPLQ